MFNSGMFRTNDNYEFEISFQNCTRALRGSFANLDTHAVVVAVNLSRFGDEKRDVVYGI